MSSTRVRWVSPAAVHLTLAFLGAVEPAAVGAVAVEGPGLADGYDWADEKARLTVMANADTPPDAARALKFGARGIGLWRSYCELRHSPSYR